MKNVYLYTQFYLSAILYIKVYNLYYLLKNYMPSLEILCNGNAIKNMGSPRITFTKVVFLDYK